MNSVSVVLVGTLFIARLLVCTLLVWKALGRLFLIFCLVQPSFYFHSVV